ncbi:hypothetical protein GCM10027430_29160 [Lysobacter tyrosinilyticus]
MSMRSVVVALISLCSLACGDGHLLSPPSKWGGDFTDRSPPTAECPGGTLDHLLTRMAVSAPYTAGEFEEDIPDSVRLRLTSDDRLHTFQFSTDPDSGDFWGFSGYLVSRGNCIIHAQVTGYDNLAAA